ncbi:hypothetical protein BGZ76_010638 [Entomortierella beljakovae]|nr:hypothetical protein BGZ76_010638 [Entomortierella beljakovae]
MWEYIALAVCFILGALAATWIKRDYNSIESENPEQCEESVTSSGEGFIQHSSEIHIAGAESQHPGGVHAIREQDEELPIYERWSSLNHTRIDIGLNPQSTEESNSNFYPDHGAQPPVYTPRTGLDHNPNTHTAIPIAV